MYFSQVYAYISYAILIKKLFLTIVVNNAYLLYILFISCNILYKLLPMNASTVLIV